MFCAQGYANYSTAAWMVRTGQRVRTHRKHVLPAIRNLHDVRMGGNDRAP